MDHPDTPKPPRQGNPVISVLRVVLWLLPAFVISIIFFISEMQTSDWFAGVIPALIVLGSLGWFDQRLCCQHLGLEPAKERSQIIRGTVAFAMLQLLVAPVVAITVIFGYCMIGGFQI